MESVFVLLWSCINKPMLPLPCPQRIISEWQTAAPASVCTEAGVMILHLYFTSKHADSLSFDRQSSSPLSSRYSQKTSPPPHRNLMCLIQLQPSVLLFTLYLCKVTLFFFSSFFWEGSTLWAIIPKARSNLMLLMLVQNKFTLHNQSKSPGLVGSTQDWNIFCPKPTDRSPSSL